MGVYRIIYLAAGSSKPNDSCYSVPRTVENSTDYAGKLMVRNIVFATLIGLIPLGAAAQALDPNAIVQTLNAQNNGPMVRALKDQGALILPVSQPIPAAFDFASMNFAVEFSADSHVLTADGMTALRSIGLALQSDALADQKFQVAAHVFSQSNPTSVQPLSARRANTVVEHLVAFYNIPPAKLVAVGYGSNSPSDPGNPYSPVNTRIQLINVTGL